MFRQLQQARGADATAGHSWLPFQLWDTTRCLNRYPLHAVISGAAHAIRRVIQAAKRHENYPAKLEMSLIQAEALRQSGGIAAGCGLLLPRRTKTIWEIDDSAAAAGGDSDDEKDDEDESKDSDSASGTQRSRRKQPQGRSFDPYVYDDRHPRSQLGLLTARARDRAERLALQMEKRYTQLVAYLLREGADVDCEDLDGVTPLMLAARSNLVWTKIAPPTPPVPV